jgi:hypothetical protein
MLLIVVDPCFTVDEPLVMIYAYSFTHAPQVSEDAVRVITKSPVKDIFPDNRGVLGHVLSLNTVYF